MKEDAALEKRIVSQGLTYLFWLPTHWDNVIPVIIMVFYYSPHESLLLPQLCLNVYCEIAYIFIISPMFLNYTI